MKRDAQLMWLGAHVRSGLGVIASPSHRLHFGEDEGSLAPVATMHAPANIVSPPVPLDWGATYVWRVDALSQVGE